MTYHTQILGVGGGEGEGEGVLPEKVIELLFPIEFVGLADL